MNEKNILSVCVIGSGAAGLCSARHLLHDENHFRVTVYEQSGQVGGTWVYTNDIGIDPKTGEEIHTSMYQNLHTNLPLNVMEFPDFPATGPKCNFESHSRVLEYLEEYARHFQLYSVIHFYHKVVHVSKQFNCDQWTVTVTDLANNKQLTQLFDAVIVASGRYSVPKIPRVKGLDMWTGKVSHTHDYRLPDGYKNRTVLVLGGGPSGVDVAIEISTVAKKVYLCHLFDPYDLSNKIIQIEATIDHVDLSEIHLTNGQVIKDVDEIVFATGYKFHFPFLDETSGIKIIDDSFIQGVYKHLISIKEPTMAILAIPFITLPFPLYHQQICFFLATLRGDFKLPSREEMEKDTEDELEYRMNQMSLPLKYCHRMGGSLMKAYDEFLSSAAKIPPISESKQEIFALLASYHRSRTRTYRQLEFTIKNNQEFDIHDPCAKCVE